MLAAAPPYLHAIIIVALTATLLAAEVDVDVIMTVMTVYSGVLALIGVEAEM